MIFKAIGLFTVLVLGLLPPTAQAQQPGKVYRVGFIYHTTVAMSAPYFEEFRQGLRDLGWVEGRNIAFEHRAAEGRSERFPELAAEKRERVGGLFALPSGMFFLHRARLVELAARHRLPAVYQATEYVTAGGLMSYAASFAGIYRGAARYVDKLLRGARPGELPIEQPTTFEMVINLKTAKALDLTIPPSLLLRATRLIE